MTKSKLFKISSVTLILGFTLIGWGIGEIFEKHFTGILIGAGIGLTLFSSTIFRLIRRMDIYNKTEI